MSGSPTQTALIMEVKQTGEKSFKHACRCSPGQKARGGTEGSSSPPTEAVGCLPYIEASG